MEVLHNISHAFEKTSDIIRLDVKVVSANSLLGIDGKEGTAKTSNIFVSVRVFTDQSMAKGVGGAHKTNVLKKSLNGTWNKSFQISAADFDNFIVFKVWAKHTLKSNVLLGMAQVPVKKLTITNNVLQIDLVPDTNDKKQVSQVQGQIQVEIIPNPLPITMAQKRLVQGKNGLCYYHWQAICRIEDMGLFTETQTMESWRVRLATQFLEAFQVRGIAHETVAQLAGTESDQNGMVILSEEEFRQNGVALDSFKLLSAHQLPPHITEQQVQNMMKWWIWNCFTTPHGGLVHHVNAFDFYLDSVSEHPKWYAQKTQGLVQIKSSTELCTKGDLYMEIAAGPHGGRIRIMTWNQLIGS